MAIDVIEMNTQTPAEVLATIQRAAFEVLARCEAAERLVRDIENWGIHQVIADARDGAGELDDALSRLENRLQELGWAKGERCPKRKPWEE
jgi:hypothetical protein